MNAYVSRKELLSALRSVRPYVAPRRTSLAGIYQRVLLEVDELETQLVLAAGKYTVGARCLVEGALGLQAGSVAVDPGVLAAALTRSSSQIIHLHTMLGKLYLTDSMRTIGLPAISEGLENHFMANASIAGLGEPLDYTWLTFHGNCAAHGALVTSCATTDDAREILTGVHLVSPGKPDDKYDLLVEGADGFRGMILHMRVFSDTGWPFDLVIPAQLWKAITACAGNESGAEIGIARMPDERIRLRSGWLELWGFLLNKAASYPNLQALVSSKDWERKNSWVLDTRQLARALYQLDILKGAAIPMCVMRVMKDRAVLIRSHEELGRMAISVPVSEVSLADGKVQHTFCFNVSLLRSAFASLNAPKLQMSQFSQEVMVFGTYRFPDSTEMLFILMPAFLGDLGVIEDLFTELVPSIDKFSEVYFSEVNDEESSG